MNRIVLDCSAAIHIVRGTDEGLGLAQLLRTREISSIMAPDLLYAEVGSALSKYWRAGYMDVLQVKRLAEAAIGLVDISVPMNELHVEALAESLRLGHSIYDMFYMVLARRNDAILMTSDRRLNALCEREGVRHIVRMELKNSPTGEREWHIAE